MDKAEAIKILKDFHDESAIFSVRTALETLHPELKESEDEMIRKEIISYLHNEKNVKRYISDIEFDKWIAWLEKQGKPRMQYGITINGVEYELIEVNEADECERCAFKEQCRRKGADVICTSVFGLDITAHHRFKKKTK